MIPLSLDAITTAVGGSPAGPTGGGETVVTAVTTDSRDVPDDSLFVALRGDRHDGHDHIGEALAAGAIAYLAERPVDDPAAPGIVVDDTWQALLELGGEVRRRVDPTVLALTGSVGKTTTKDLTAAGLGAELATVAAEGSYNNEVGVPLTCLAIRPDTEALVVEIGARGVGHIAALAPAVAPDVAIVTVVAGAHLEMFGDLETVARAKRELVESLDVDGTAVLNADDRRVAAMADAAPGRVLTFAVDTDADVTARGVRLDRLARATFTARSPWGEVEVSLPIAGAHHVTNALAALTAAGAVGVDVGAAAAAIGAASVSEWRSAVIEADGLVVLNDAYNANPLSVRAAVETLVRVERPAGARTWAVLGVMAELGAGSERAHEEVGEHCVARGVDRLVVVGEEAAPMLAGARSAGMPADHRHHVADAEGALELVAGAAGDGDVVLVKASRVAGLERVAEGLAVGDAR